MISETDMVSASKSNLTNHKAASRQESRSGRGAPFNFPFFIKEMEEVSTIHQIPSLHQVNHETFSQGPS
jgi:hypothetical protein